jgi:hypothetical protein
MNDKETWRAYAKETVGHEKPLAERYLVVKQILTAINSK